jgi:DNA-binding response OmpR family regulator
MPRMDGFEVARWLKANALTQRIPIIIVTALQDVASHKRMLASGADEFINKPVDRWELSMRIAKLLQSRRDSITPAIDITDRVPNG